jgi:uncharacterized membrane protein YjdF
MNGVLTGLLREAAWAPAGVVLLSVIAIGSPYADALYWPLHFLGGAALAFFFFEALRIARELIGAVQVRARYVFAFALACTVAIFWELAEFAVDEIAGTQLQEDLWDTMVDLLLDLLGAAAGLGWVAIRHAKRGGA